MATTGVGAGAGDAESQPPNHHLQLLWRTIYRQIKDIYISRHEKVTKIPIDDKNLCHISGVTDRSKSVISPTFSTQKLCKTTFYNFSRSCVEVTTDKNKNL